MKKTGKITHKYFVEILNILLKSNLVKKDRKGHFSRTEKEKQQEKNMKKKGSSNSFKSFFMKKDISYFHESAIIQHSCGNRAFLCGYCGAKMWKAQAHVGFFL